MSEREQMAFDVVVVGAGPSGLAAAIRLKQCDPALSVCVIDKGSEVGAHILSGAVFEPRALDELLPDWRERGAPLDVPAGDDRFLLLSAKRARRLPTPPSLRNHGNYIISLASLCRWLAGQAEALGVEIFAGFAAAELLYDADGAVKGVATGDMGVGKEGVPGPNFTPGIELLGRQTILAEGCRGSLSKSLSERFDLRAEADPQTYGLGIKELWEIDPAHHQTGSITHTIGWPLDAGTYGGSFLYHLDHTQVAVGFVIGLDYRNPFLSPFEEFQRFKSHPAIAPIFAGGRRIAYGARAVSEGGLQSLPRLTVPGAVLVGDAAGFLNVAKVKGSHAAMKSGMLAAESIAVLLKGEGREALGYSQALQDSWLWQELHAVRNVRPSFHRGLWPGLAYSAVEYGALHGKVPWTLGNHADHPRLKEAEASRRIDYPRPDGVLRFDRLSSVFVSNTHHEENQPPHLKLADPLVPITINHRRFDSPEQRYCPAGVYELVGEDTHIRLQINAANCLHCKTCDIKDPTQNITWTVPEGGGGPNYPNM
ncbi:electron transfer flavoprotein-ubiquinone oxidoreductase [Magnetospirillum fulvum]|uniref:Electron transfer flavoprotein-ubiquinone oxidoreductase n=1 Tax=Magnetospirillum fulvum TaxID=1082 RepID=A0A1H6GWL9_MAGFU|nr:electron transfer flavoprotein-ubiquinone oxidoreductase [Magnetospirillum fulvum]SEH26253.1 electron-transferring-flavoprotein dehydrogenase [Magnetospirillum fulvum]